MRLFKRVYPYQEGVYFFLFIPILNALAYTFTGWIRIFGFVPGQLRGLILTGFIIWFFSRKRLENTLSGNLLWVFLFYLLSLTFFSSNFTFTFSIYTKVLFSTLLFFIAFYYTKSISVFKTLNNAFIISLLFFVLSALYGLIFGFGGGYADSVTMGTKGPNIAKNISTLLLIFPLVFQFNFPDYSRLKKLLVKIIFIAGFLVVLISMKRSTILVVIIGYFIYFLLNQNKGKLIKAGLGFSFILLISFPLYITYLDTAYTARGDRALIGAGDYEEESRYLEFYRVLNAFKEGSIKHKLVGSELFNDRQFFGVRRMLHTDYAAMLNGSGILGLFLFILIPIILILDLRNLCRINKRFEFPYINQVYAVGVSLLVTSYIHGIAGSIQGIDLRAYMFLYIGALMGLLRNAEIVSNYEEEMIQQIKKI